jgi:hypothetical protein
MTFTAGIVLAMGSAIALIIVASLVAQDQALVGESFLVLMKIFQHQTPLVFTLW